MGECDLIRNELVRRGQELFTKPRAVIKFTGNPDANALVNDLENYPHAFVLACLMNRQLKAEKVWAMPHEFAHRLGEKFSMAALQALSLEEVTHHMTTPRPLHRYANRMATIVFVAIQRIATQYEGDASHIWANQPASAEVVYRFLEFDGAGPKIATMAANILAREFKIPFADFYSIDVSVDIHVRRVFRRLGLCDSDASVESLIYKARALSPTFPGLLDLPCWEIGRTWCHAHDPDCAACYMDGLCSHARE